MVLTAPLWRRVRAWLADRPARPARRPAGPPPAPRPTPRPDGYYETTECRAGVHYEVK